MRGAIGRDAVIAVVCSAAALLQTAGWASAAGDPLAQYRWTKRVLVIFAPGDGDLKLARQRSLLANSRPGVANRDLVVIEVGGGAAHGSGADALRARFAVAPDSFSIVLVGKDGDPKFASAEPVATSTLFGRIDAMPMRRAGFDERCRDLLQPRAQVLRRASTISTPRGQAQDVARWEAPSEASRGKRGASPQSTPTEGTA